jgi:hypothetical protein
MRTIIAAAFIAAGLLGGGIAQAVAAAPAGAQLPRRFALVIAGDQTGSTRPVWLYDCKTRGYAGEPVVSCSITLKAK